MDRKEIINKHWKQYLEWWVDNKDHIEAPTDKGFWAWYAEHVLPNTKGTVVIDAIVPPNKDGTPKSEKETKQWLKENPNRGLKPSSDDRKS